MEKLYPLKFRPILQEKIWGGTLLVAEFGKDGNPTMRYGESWELSAVEGNISVASNGSLAGKNIEELIEEYKGELIGESVYRKTGNEFPILLKIIETRADTSIQVHPNDELAMERHGKHGKAEMWYVLNAKPYAKIYAGFNRPVNQKIFSKAVRRENVPSLLCCEPVVEGNVFFAPAGTVHAIGAGTTFVELQETSDVTYRIYDWERVDDKGNYRELHNDLAIDAIDFSKVGSGKTFPIIDPDTDENLADCKYFTTDIMWLTKPAEKDYSQLDSFVIYFCISGKLTIKYGDGESEKIGRAETILIPAAINNVVLEPEPEAKFLEIYIKQ